MARQPSPAPLATGTALLIAGVLLTLAISSVVAFRGWPGLTSGEDAPAAAVLDAPRAGAEPAGAADDARRATLGRGRLVARSRDGRSAREAARRARSRRGAGARSSGQRAVARIPASSPAARTSPPAAGGPGPSPRATGPVPVPVTKPAEPTTATEPVREVVETTTSAVDEVTQTDLVQQVGNVLLDVRDLLP